MLGRTRARWRRAGGPATDAHPVERVASQPCAASWRVTSIARLAALNARSKAFQLFGTLGRSKDFKRWRWRSRRPTPRRRPHLGPRAPAARSAWPPTARSRRVRRMPARTRRRRRLSRRPLRPHAAVPVARRRAACRAPGRHRLLPAHPADPGGGRLPVGVVPGAVSGVPRMNPPPRHLAARRPLAHRQPTARRCALGSQCTRRRG